MTNAIRIRFAIDQDHEQGRMILIDGPKWSSQEQKLAEKEIRDQYQVLRNGQETFVFRGKLGGLGPGAVFRVTRLDGSTGRAQELLLEHAIPKPMTKAAPGAPPWIDGFLEDLRIRAKISYRIWLAVLAKIGRKQRRIR